jgi:cytochrome c-type biogenesis protein CcmH/NrfG
VDQFQRVVRLAPEEDTVHYLLAQAYRQQGRQGEAKAELARFEEMAKKKSEQRKEAARQLVESTGEAQQPQPELEPGFSPSRNPVHP